MEYQDDLDWSQVPNFMLFLERMKRGEEKVISSVVDIKEIRFVFIAR